LAAADSFAGSIGALELDSGLRMHPERTPNPNSVKWVLDRPIAGAGRVLNFAQRPDADAAPLASALFDVNGVTGVLLGADFVTVSKGPDVDWAELAPPIGAAIKLWAESGRAAVTQLQDVEPRAADDDVMARIRKILDEEIAPYVAQDGGEVRFVGFEDGVVQVVLQGACEGCPSSSVTLKLGIEARLREKIPEVRSVIALS
jgi:Fe-S cluster biogenesis protein NfuA